jgi:hypothetical protein
MPRFSDSRAEDVFEMADLTGFELDPWQRLVVEGACGVRADGKWASKEVGVNVPRQNGKGGILELIEVTALFTWHEQLVIHSAHEFITSQKHFDRVWSLVESTPELLQRVVRQRPLRSHGHEGFKLVDGCQIEFRTRTKGGGRGFSCDRLILDEAMFLPESAMGALLPTMRARPNPQIWYTGSAVDQEVHTDGLVFTRVRNRALERAPDLSYFEWSLPYDHPNDIPDDEYSSEEAMRRSNPAFGIRIFREHFEMELAALDRRTAAVELYGVGDYPDPTGEEDRPISVEQWLACQDEDSHIVGPVCFGFDVSPERRTSIAAAGRNQDGRWHVEVIEKLPGTGWLPTRLYDLVVAHEPQAIVADKIGPGASTISKLEDLGVPVTLMDGAQHAQSCARLVDAVAEDNLRHLGSLDLLNAIRAASTRQLADRWLWSRRNSTVDISPLVAATLALSAAMGQPEDTGEVTIF